MTDLPKGGGALAKVQKTLARTKTKVLQRVGKAEKTADDSFKENVANFNRQQATALRLQKELKHYLVCVKAMTMAASNLFAVMKETYEEDWLDPETVDSSLNSLDLMQTSYEAELAERVYVDLSNYVEQFPLYKEKINKRRRKLLDFDNSRHEYESLANAKKPDHSKICKAQESLQEAKTMFDDINGELHRELPRFYDYRIEFMANNLSKLFTTESTFHSNCGELDDKLVGVLQSLATTHSEEMKRLKSVVAADQNNRGDRSATATDHPETLDLSSLSAIDPQSPKTNGHKEEVSSPVKQPPSNKTAQQSSAHETEIRMPSTASPVDSPKSPNSPLHLDSNRNPFESTSKRCSGESSPSSAKVSKPKSPPPDPPVNEPGNPFLDDKGDPLDDGVFEEAVKPQSDAKESIKVSQREEENKPSTSTSSTSNGPILYQVMATHPYTAEDEDELTFEAGEIINVVEFDDEDEQDEGWLMGISTKSNTKGVFPANFTQKIPKSHHSAH